MMSDLDAKSLVAATMVGSDEYMDALMVGSNKTDGKKNQKPNFKPRLRPELNQPNIFTRLDYPKYDIVLCDISYTRATL